MITIEWCLFVIALTTVFGLINFYRCVKLEKTIKNIIASEEPLKRENVALREELGRKLEDIAKEIDIRIMDVLESPEKLINV